MTGRVINTDFKKMFEVAVITDYECNQWLPKPNSEFGGRRKPEGVSMYENEGLSSSLRVSNLPNHGGGVRPAAVFVDTALADEALRGQMSQE